MLGPRPHPDRSRERAFTLMELVVVMLIVCILLGGAILSVRSARANSHRAAAVAVAGAYQRAIEQYASEHGELYPPAPGSGPNWPSPAEQGPVDATAGGRGGRYLTSVPEAVQDGTVSFGGGGGSRASVTYERAGSSYRLVVRWGDGDQRACVLPDAGDGLPRC
jgi:prepilin-type N-terminal cleavage/methylation domain-containing protein